jgi:RNA polymerase sigma factor (sigma-70 family)
MTAEGSPEHVPIEALLAHREWVRALARSIYFDRNDADDLEQETWRIALERPPRHSRSLRAWFATAVRHAAISAGRKTRVRSAREAAAQARGSDPSPTESLAAAELQTRIARAVLDLEEPYRTTVVLRYFDGLEAAAIAVRLRVPVETVRTRLKRAIERLRARMRVENEDDRASWCLLVFGGRTGDGTPLAPVAATVSTTTALGGGLAMATGTKLVVAAVVLAAGAAWWATRQHDPTQSRVGVASAPVPGSDAAASAPATRASRNRVRGEAEADATAKSVASVPAPEAPLGPDVVHGRVIDDETSAPVPKATVSLVWEHARRPRTEPTTVTAADGTFRIPDAKDGTFGELLLHGDGYADCLVDLPWRDQNTKLAKNDAGDVRIFRGKRIAGRVVASDGVSPVAGARILLSTSGGSSSLMWINDAIDRGTTDGSGVISLDRVPPSHAWPYTVFAVMKAGVGWAKLPGDAGRVDTEGVTVTLRPNGGATVTVRDEAGAPKAGVEVCASPRFEPLGPRPEWDVGHDVDVRDSSETSLFLVKTDPQGVARFASLPTVDERPVYDFVVADRTKGARAWKSATVRAGETATVEVVVNAPRSRWISGLVHDADGKPVAGATFRVGRVNGATTTGADGRFRILVVDAGAWSDRDCIQVKAAGFAELERSIKPDPNKDVLELDLVMKPASPISGRVVDQDGKPVAGANVSTERDDASINGRQVTTDEGGRFTFRDTTAGEYRLQVRPPSPEDEWEYMPPYAVRGGEKDAVLLQRRTAPGKARVVVTIVDDAGAPLAPDQASTDGVDESASSAYAKHGRIELGNGRVVIERMKPGRWNLWLHVPDRLGRVARVEVPDAQVDVAVRVVVEKPGVVRGRVDVGDTGAPMPQMVVPALADGTELKDWAYPHGPKMVRAARVAADGTFEFPEVMPGRWRIFTPGVDFVGEGFADVPAGGEGACVVRMTQTGTVALRLAAASPTKTVECWFGREDAPLRKWASRSVSTDGRTALESRLAPGRWRWRVSFPSEGSWGLVRVAAETQEGEVLVTAGQTVRVEVPVVPK